MFSKFCLFMLLIFSVSAQSQDDNLSPQAQKVFAERDVNSQVNAMVALFDATSEIDPIALLKTEGNILLHAQDIENAAVEAIALAHIAYCYRSLGNTEKSFAYAVKASEVASKLNNDKVKVQTQVTLALCYKDIENYDKALEILADALRYAQVTKDDLARRRIYENFAEIYVTTDKIDSALVYAQKDYEISMRLKRTKDLGFTFKNLGAIHGRLGNYKLANEYYTMAIANGVRIGSPKVLNWALTSKAKYMVSRKLKDSASIYAKKAIDAVKNTPFENYKLASSKILLDIYTNTNIDSAFRYSEMYRVAKDSLFNLKSIQQTQIMAFELQQKKQMYDAAREKEAEDDHEYMQYALIAFGIVCMIILFLLLSRTLIINKRVIEFLGVMALLIVFEYLNLLLHTFIENVTGHSIILMLLILVATAALLVPLHHKVEKWATGKLVEKNQAIRIAAAKKTLHNVDENGGVRNEENH